MAMAVAAVAAALSQQQSAAAANAERHSHSNRASQQHSRASSSASMRPGRRTHTHTHTHAHSSSAVVSPQHSPAHALRKRDRGGAEAYHAVVSWALDPAFPLDELCAAAAAPFVRPWRWLLCAVPILALYIAADVFSALALPVPSFGGDDFDAFVTGGWVTHYVGMVLFLAALIGLFFRRHPFHARFLLLLSCALVFFLVSSVLHTSRLSASASLWSSSASHSVLAVQLSWLANALFYVLYCVLAYRAPAAALKDPHPDDKEKLETLLEIRRAELLRLQRVAETAEGDRAVQEKRAARAKEDAEKREWYAARKAARKLEKEREMAAAGSDGVVGADADLVVTDVHPHDDHAPTLASAAGRAPAPASAFASAGSAASVAGPVRVSRVESSDSPTPAAAAASALSPSALSTFSLPLPSSYLRDPMDTGTGTGVSSVIHYTMPSVSATSSVVGLGYDRDGGGGSGHHSIWNTMQPPSAAESRTPTAPATPAQGPLHTLLSGNGSGNGSGAQRAQTMQTQLHASPEPLSAGWQLSQQHVHGHHRGSASNGGSADLHFYSPQPYHHHHQLAHHQAHSLPDLGALHLPLPLAPVVTNGAAPGLPLHVVYDESPLAPSVGDCDSDSAALSLPLPPFPPHHPELALALGQVNVSDSPSEQDQDLAAQVLTPGRSVDHSGARAAAATTAAPPAVAPAWPSLSQPLVLPSGNEARRASWGRVVRAEE